MKVQIKITLINLVVIMVLMMIIYAIVYTIINKSYLNLENKQINEDTERLLEIEQRELESLISSNNDWAKWTDTYDFMNGNNPDFLGKNINDGVLKNLGIDFMVFINNSYDLLYIYTHSSLDKRIQSEIVDYINRNTNLFTQEIAGYIKSSKDIFRLSASSVQTSERTGNFSGYLLMGYILNEEKLSIIQSQVKVPLEIIESKILGEELKKIPGNTNLIKKEKEFIEVFAPINDLYKQEVATIKMTIPRDIYLQEKQTSKLIFLAMGTLFMLFFFSLIIINYFLSKRITDPLSDLNELTSEINKGNLDLEFKINRDSEIQFLVESIKKMMEKIKESQVTLEDKVKERTKELKIKNHELEEFNKLFVNREIRMKELKKEIEKLKGGKK